MFHLYVGSHRKRFKNDIERPGYATKRVFERFPATMDGHYREFRFSHFWSHFQMDVRLEVPRKRFETLRFNSKRWIHKIFKISVGEGWGTPETCGKLKKKQFVIFWSTFISARYFPTKIYKNSVGKAFENKVEGLKKPFLETFDQNSSKVPPKMVEQWSSFIASFKLFL